MKRILISGIAALGCAGSLLAISDSELESIFAKMTLDEKIGQLVQIQSSGKSGGAESQDATGVKMPAEVVDAIRGGKVGSLIGACGIEKFNAFQRVAMQESRLKIPLMVGHDMIHGVKTQLPIPLALSCSWDEDVWLKGGELIAFETPLKGCNWTFAPMVDIARDPRWGRIAEGPGQDPYLASKMSAALVKGIQTDKAAMPIAACLKHYAAYGAASGGRDYNEVEMSESTFRNVYLPSFQAGVDAGALTVMPAFHSLNGVPCSVNKWLLTDVLRKQLGFKGFTISDWNAIGESDINLHGMGETRDDVTALAIGAGMDQDMLSNHYRDNLKAQVESGRVSMADVNRSVRNILKTKNALGLWEKPYIDEKAVNEKVDLAKNAELAREVAAKCCVLLKNEKNTLPLRKGAKVALVGPGAENAWNIVGCWASWIDNVKNVTITEGLKADGFDVTYAKCYDYREGGVDIAQLKKTVGKADIVIAIFGEPGNEAGEGVSKSRIELPKVQIDALNELKKLGKPVVALMMNGRPMAIPELAQSADAILEAWSSGTSGGWGIADVLTGRVNPSARLTTEFPYATGQLPLYYNRPNTGRPTQKSVHYASCYIDGPHYALYPFGYGLSYSKFVYSNEKVTVGESALVMEADVKNESAVDGVETVQAYTRQRVGVETRPVRELRAWKKVPVKAGETVHVALEIPLVQLDYWARDVKIKAAGPFYAWIAPDSASGKQLEFRLP